MTDLDQFRALLDQFPSIAKCARITGRTFRSLAQKRDGERGVDRWDVLALERALQLYREQKPS